jgi:hypothetical protein
MKSKPRLTRIAAALGAAGLFGIGNAAGHGFVCDGVVTGGTIDQNVVVPPGAECILNAVTVHGNIEVRSDDVHGGGELYFGVIEGGEGGICIDDTSNVSGNIAVKGSKNAFAGFGIGAPVGCPAVLNLGSDDDRANLAIDRAHVYQLNAFLPDTINVHGNVSIANSDRDGLPNLIYAINVINTTAPSGKIQKSNMKCKNNVTGGLFANYTVGGNLSGDGSCFP